MKKRELLHRWLLAKDDWVYLREVPYLDIGMSRQTCSSELRSLCESRRADCRIVGYTQYKGKLSPQQIREVK